MDGRLKVTGAAKYSVEFEAPGCAYGWTVESNIAKGKITAIDTKAAQGVPGVLAVLTHLNTPKFKSAPKKEGGGGGSGIRNEERFPLNDDEVHYAGQYLAVVVAETLQQAQHAADLVKITYETATPLVETEQAMSTVYDPSEFFGEKLKAQRGDPGYARGNFGWRC